MKSEVFITTSEVAEILGVSRSKAYKVVRELNMELAEKGFITVSGKVSRKYFAKKFYGFDEMQTDVQQGA